MSPPAASPCRHHDPEVLEVRTVSGFDVKLDPEPLTPLDELVAAVAGRSTFTVYAVSGDVHARSAYKIRHSPAGSVDRATVHALHRCTPSTGSTTRMSP